MSIVKDDWYRMALCDAADAYGEAHRNVLEVEKNLSALREERTNLWPETELSKEGRRARIKALKKIFSKQTALVTRWGNVSQKRNKELSALEKILKEYAVLESK
jgi:hypothetical protein